MSNYCRWFLVALVCCPALALADFPVPTNSEADVNAEPMDANEAAEKMQLPVGFKATVFASEPDVQNPIAMTWDLRGRLWVAENFTYSDPKQRFDLSMRDRVLVFDDKDHDGVADSRTVFTDQVQMLTSVEVGHGGVWLMCPPQVLFIPDADEDLVPDGPTQVVIDGFDVAKDNYHNFANGLRFGPDGWLYGRCGGSCPGRIGLPGQPEENRVAIEGGMWRYHPQRKTVESICAGTTNPWGHDWNEYGDLFFINTVNGHFWQAIPGAHFNRPFNLDPNPHTYLTIDQHADHYHFDTGKSWTESRDGAANSLGGGHAHCGAMFYNGTQWPASYQGKFFTSNFHGRRLNQENVQASGSGYVASHDDDFCFMQDPFYRGMDLSVGPDGSVYVLDWSDTGECHESTGVHRTSGRIFRITHGGNDANGFEPQSMQAETKDEWAVLFQSKNQWIINQTRLRLAHQQSIGVDVSAARDALMDLMSSDDVRVATQSMMSLIAMDSMGTDDLYDALESPYAPIRSWAIRGLVDAMPIDDVYGPKNTVSSIDAQTLSKLVSLAVDEPSPHVRLSLASALQRLPLSERTVLAGALVSHAEDANDHNLPLMIYYGLMPLVNENADELAGLADNCKLPLTQRLLCRRIGETMNEDASAVEVLLALAISLDPATQENILLGLVDATRGWTSAKKPSSWDAFTASIGAQEPRLTQLAGELGLLFGDGRAIEAIRKVVLDSNAEIGVRRSALIALVNQRPADLRSICTSLLRDQRLSSEAVKGLILDDNIENAKSIIENFGRFRGTDRPSVIASLVSRPTFASELIDAIDRGQIDRVYLSAFDARQIRSFGDDELSDRLSRVWGNSRPSPAEKREQMVMLRQSIEDPTAPVADLGNGRVVYNQLCAKCHRMYGDGEAIGPDLTGSDRANLDYLVENIIDPSAIVPANYRVSVLIIDDGRVLNGTIISRNEKTLTLQTQTDRIIVPLESIEAERLTDQSPMPEGQLDALSAQQIRDLFAYLRHPSQVALPKN